MKYFIEIFGVVKKNSINKNNKEILYIIKRAKSSYKDRIPIDSPGYKSINAKNN